MIFQSNDAKKNQTTLTSIWFELDRVASYISLSLFHF